MAEDKALKIWVSDQLHDLLGAFMQLNDNLSAPQDIKGPFDIRSFSVAHNSLPRPSFTSISPLAACFDCPFIMKRVCNPEIHTLLALPRPSLPPILPISLFSGLSESMLVSYVLSLAKKASSTASLAAELEGQGLPQGARTRTFAQELLARLPQRGGGPTSCVHPLLRSYFNTLSSLLYIVSITVSCVYRNVGCLRVLDVRLTVSSSVFLLTRPRRYQQHERQARDAVRSNQQFSLILAEEEEEAVAVGVKGRATGGGGDERSSLLVYSVAFYGVCIAHILLLCL